MTASELLLGALLDEWEAATHDEAEHAAEADDDVEEAAA